MKMDAARIKISSVFKLNGLIIQRDAAAYLANTLLTIPKDERSDWLNRVIDTVQRQELASTVISVDDARRSVEASLEDADNIGNNEILSVVDAYTVPKFIYNQERKKFLPVSSDALSLFGNTTTKTEIFLDRYAIIHQRLLRHDVFRPPTSGRAIDEQNSNRFGLKPIEYLLGTSSTINEVIVLGMLSQMKEGCYHLEDPTGAIKLDLTKTKFHSGFFAESCFILVEGSYEDGVLQAQAIGFPPTELSNATRMAFGSTNFFDRISKTCPRSSSKLKAFEEANRDAAFVFVADVHLDDVTVLGKLRQMFFGFAECPPTCFVLMGNFTCVQQDSCQPKGSSSMAECFTKLADLILEFPSVATTSKFVFVPGPQDLGLSTILPRPKIPQSIVESITRRIPDVLFTTNPCRIRYCTQEIVIFREDLMNKMCRNCVHFPEEGEVATHLAKTLLSQSHLCPLPLHISPVYWDYDHALRLYPIPDLLVLGDRHDPYKVEHAECHIINPGSFSKSSYVFKVYVPALRQVEDSQISVD